MGGSAGQLVGAVARWISHSIDVFVGTADYTPEINAPFDGTSSEEMNDLCGRCQTFYCYTKVLENIAQCIESGEIRVLPC